MELWRIQLFGRWGSNVFLTYVRDAPIAQLDRLALESTASLSIETAKVQLQDLLRRTASVTGAASRVALPSPAMLEDTPQLPWTLTVLPQQWHTSAMRPVGRFTAFGTSQLSCTRAIGARFAHGNSPRTTRRILCWRRRQHGAAASVASLPHGPSPSPPRPPHPRAQAQGGEDATFQWTKVASQSCGIVLQPLGLRPSLITGPATGIAICPL